MELNRDGLNGGVFCCGCLNRRVFCDCIISLKLKVFFFIIQLLNWPYFMNHIVRGRKLTNVHERCMVEMRM
ncbi:Uncharacterized protein M6B38_214115 [Iris pallida]|uniref:Uncharacterized protein n=1 Tax=Iris pallida TaxID=29817 RepID=A0AAX6E2Q3_IRIPA|nr:Uncharacterized protein M6B38_214115 [Iris pallida]